MKNRSTKVAIETMCTESSIRVYIDYLDGNRKEVAGFLFPEIYNLSEAQATKISRAAATAVVDTLKRCVGLKSRPYKVPYKVSTVVTGYVGGVAFPSSFHGKMTLECTQLTCPENTGILCIHNEDSWLSAENVDTALQIFKWHSHRFYKSLEELRWQIPRF